MAVVRNDAPTVNLLLCEDAWSLDALPPAPCGTPLLYLAMVLGNVNVVRVFLLRAPSRPVLKQWLEPPVWSDAEREPEWYCQTNGRVGPTYPHTVARTEDEMEWQYMQIAKLLLLAGVSEVVRQDVCIHGKYCLLLMLLEFTAGKTTGELCRFFKDPAMDAAIKRRHTASASALQF